MLVPASRSGLPCQSPPPERRRAVSSAAAAARPSVRSSIASFKRTLALWHSGTWALGEPAGASFRRNPHQTLSSINASLQSAKSGTTHAAMPNTQSAAHDPSTNGTGATRVASSESLDVTDGIRQLFLQRSRLGCELKWASVCIADRFHKRHECCLQKSIGARCGSSVASH